MARTTGYGSRPQNPWRALRLPDWVDAALDAGVVGSDMRLRRRQRFTNVAAYALAINAFVHLAVNSFHDFAALLPVNVYNLAMTVFCLLVPWLHRFGRNIAVNVLILVAVAGHAYVVFAFGLASNLHVYFTLAGFILVLVGVQHWRNFLVLFAASAAALIIVMAFASEDGFVMVDDLALRDSLAFQAMVATMLINAAVIAYILFTLDRAETSLQHEYDRSELLLTTILPANIAERLKREQGRRIADHLDGVTVLFSDLVGFTPAAAAATPEQVVRYLHGLFARFDALCEAHGVDKIKTIGDAYMAVGGIRDDGGAGMRRIGNLALDMLEVIGGEELEGHALTMRIGIHCGPVVAGVIGDSRMTYDMWGDTVNFASRLESNGVPGRIQVSRAFRDATADTFDFEPRGTIPVKGIGPSEAFLLVGLRR